MLCEIALLAASSTRPQTQEGAGVVEGSQDDDGLIRYAIAILVITLFTFRQISQERVHKSSKFGVFSQISTYEVNVDSLKLTNFTGEFIEFLNRTIQRAIKNCKSFFL